ncbi:hypothetical protein [Pseudofulvibacter geojedonensis]|uniref:Uncharacterized protein n=1 Tax=Pseudofulvibacter geojedonensis TaxID=1123758 RepID=A0ABW3I453_9FLAO
MKANNIKEKFYFKLNNNISEYSNLISNYSISPNNHFEVKYDLYISELKDFSSLFNLPFFRKPLLLFYLDKLCSVFYKFQGNQLEYLDKILKEFIPNELYITRVKSESIVYRLEEDLIIHVRYKDDDTTGLCMKNKQFHEDGLK